MKILKSFGLFAIVLTSFTFAAQAQTPPPTVESVAPVVTKTTPQAGDTNVAPGITEIKVTFSKDMTDNLWSWSSAWQNSTPESIGKPKYEADRRTCVLKVKLEPGKTYGYWINSQKFHGFQDSHGQAAVPYLLVFKTKEK